MKMGKSTIFSADRMRVFASLIHDQLGVQVRIKGRSICVDMKRKIIYLPNLEVANDDDGVKVLHGFAIHEAGHVRYTKRQVMAGIKDYLEKTVHNGFEDQYIERRLRKTFPGAKEMLRLSHERGYTVAVAGEGRALFNGSDEPYLNNPDAIRKIIDRIGSEKIVERMAALGLPVTEDSIISEVGKRLEVERLIWLWLYEWRDGSDAALRQKFIEHPWKPILDEINVEKTRNTHHSLEKTRQLLRTLGVHPVLPNDVRPVDELAQRTTAAKEKRAAYKAAKLALKQLLRQRRIAVRERLAMTPEHSKLIEARGRVAEQEQNVREAQEHFESQVETAFDADDAVRRVKGLIQRLEARLKDARDEQIQRLKERLVVAQAVLRRRSEKALAANVDAKAAETACAYCDEELDRLKDELAAAEAAYRRVETEIRQEVNDRFAPAIEKANADIQTAKAEAKAAAEALTPIAVEIAAKDKDADAQIAPGVVEKVVEAVIEKVRSMGLAEELGELLPRDPEDETAELSGRSAPVTALSARKYMPYDRSHDRADTVTETPEARAAYEKARQEYAKVIDETAVRLRRLHSPVQTRLRTNADAGRLDQRKMVRVGMAMRGLAAVDLSRVWKTTTVKPNPKVAVTLLLDCSGSMSGEKIQLARKSACCLSEVMRRLSIPHEILGHTTHADGIKEMLKDCETPGEFSRLTPFQGFIFKRFEDAAGKAVSTFCDYEMQDNLDGEAVRWAVERLANRPEATKVCIVLCDGMPNAEYSNVEELERHLYTVVRQIEAQRPNGVYLAALGIGEERVREFYQNAEVLNDVTDLPKSVLGLVERILLAQEAG